ncbi:MAG: hypothetical protein IJU08_10260 [Bacteroidales bacterium]|nr:hypothetical protein [Bacteroidales bacterium]
MIRKILLTTLILILAGGLLGCWFHFVGILSAEGHAQARCRQVDIILLDSLESAIVDKAEVQEYVAKRTLGRQTSLVNLDSIEKALRARGEVMSAEVYAADEQTVAVRLTQRKPVIRFENGHHRWYADPEGYLFPVTNAVDVPIVTGRIPVHVDSTWRGETPEENLEWVLGMVELARYIDSKPVLKQEIAQIDVEPEGDLVLYTRTAGPAIIFGDSGNCVEKFRKLEAWWRNIAPQVDGNKPYKTINLKYNHQIICKQP